MMVQKKIVTSHQWRLIANVGIKSELSGFSIIIGK